MKRSFKRSDRFAVSITTRRTRGVFRCKHALGPVMRRRAGDRMGWDGRGGARSFSNERYAPKTHNGDGSQTVPARLTGGRDHDYFFTRRTRRDVNLVYIFEKTRPAQYVLVYKTLAFCSYI